MNNKNKNENNMNAFKRLDDNTIVLDGLVWHTNPEKKQKFINTLTDDIALNVIVEGESYYPAAYAKGYETNYAMVREAKEQ